MGDKVACPKCKSPWQSIVNNMLICKCGYREEVSPKPNIEQLLKENAHLKKRIEKLLTSTPDKPL